MKNRNVEEFSVTSTALPLTEALPGRELSPCWPWRAWEAKNSAFHLSSQDVRGRKLGWIQEEDSSFFAHQTEEDGSADVDRKIVDEIWTTVIWVIYDGGVHGHEGFSCCSWWRITSWWRSRSAWSIKKGPGERDKMEAQVEVSQQRSAGGLRCQSGREKGRTGYSLWHNDRAARRM